PLPPCRAPFDGRCHTCRGALRMPDRPRRRIRGAVQARPGGDVKAWYVPDSCTWAPEDRRNCRTVLRFLAAFVLLASAAGRRRGRLRDQPAAPPRQRVPL